MNKKKITCFALSALMCVSTLGIAACGSESSSVDADAVLSVDAANKGAKINDDLFGIFLEDINYCGDALNSEMIENKTFGYSSQLLSWKKTSDSTAYTPVKKATDGLSTTNTDYIRLENTGTSESGITNDGFVDGMVIKKDAEYKFSVYLRTGTYNGDVIARINSGTEKAGEIVFKAVPSEEWVKYEGTIKSDRDSSKDVTFSFLLGEQGAVDVDVVSLDPVDNMFGFRGDLVEAMQGLSPNFVRFPGGCIIEGKNLELAYDWKDSIGVDKATNKAVSLETTVVKPDGSTSVEKVTGVDALRKTGGNVWTNQTDYGIGFYEYFMLCDYLGATAVPVVNCGIACMIQGKGESTVIGSDEYKYYVQSALDLVAFAKGDVNSKDQNEAYWASVRTAMGHADPFEMDYLGVGNEQWGDNYFLHFEGFRDAFIEAAKTNDLYSTVELIVGNGAIFSDTEYCETDDYKSYGTEKKPLAKSRMNVLKKEGKIEKNSDYAIVDEHYYMNYTDFLDNTDHYDTYSREENKKYYVFAGEYSANSDTDLRGNTFAVTMNSMRTATAEAAYMTGIERNGDIVKLASYAPVFGHLKNNYKQWNVDMIYYDKDGYVPSCNYYVQQMFAQNQGDYVLTAGLTYNSGKEEYATFKIGREGKTTVKTEDSLYYNATVDKNGDIIVKVVNANTKQDIAVEIKLNGVSYENEIEATILQNEEYDALNVKSEKSTLNAKGGFVYQAKKNSVAVLRIKTK